MIKFKTSRFQDDIKLNVLLLTFRLNRGKALGKSLRNLGHSVVVEAVGLPNVSVFMNLWRLVTSYFRNKGRFDVVITESLDYNGLLALLLSLFNGTLFVVHLKGFYPADSLDTASDVSRWIDDKVSIAVLSRASHIVYNSRYLKAQYADYFVTRGEQNIVNKSSTIIHQSVDEEYFEENASIISRVRRILYVGNLDFKGKYRGVRLLLGFWSNYRHEDDLVLTIVGSGRYLQNIKELVEKDGIENVELLGYVSKLDLIPLYSSSYLFMYPSYQDALPSVVIEAQAMGLPAVVTNTSGAQEIVDDGVTGIVCDPEIGALEKAFTRLLDAQLRDEMSHEARRRIKEVFTWDVAASKFVTILNNLNP